MSGPAHSLSPVLSRRAALAGLLAGAAVALAGCTDEEQPAQAGQDDVRRPALDPDVTLAGLALSSVQEVLHTLETTVDRHRRLAPQLAPLAAAHQAHVDLLTRAAPDPPPSPSPDPLESPTVPSPSPSPTSEPGEPPAQAPGGAPAGPPAASPTGPPADPRAAVAAVREAEDRLSTRLRRHAFVAQSGQFATLLASMSAASAQHVAVLASVRPPARRGAAR